MANVYNRVTKVYLKSVHTPDYTGPEWIVNPVGADLLIAAGVALEEWAVNPDQSVREMTASEKSAELLDATKDRKVSELREACIAYLHGKYDMAGQITLNALWNEGNSKKYASRTSKVQSIMDWVSLVLKEFYDRKKRAVEATTVEAVKAVGVDFSMFNAGFPDIAIEEVFNEKA